MTECNVTRGNATSSSVLEEDDGEFLTAQDAGWILKNAFTVMTMQSGFGLLEAGCVSGKSPTSIMVKNVADVLFGGLVYWAVGYGMSFGRSPHGIVGLSDFFVTGPADHRGSGTLYATYTFQFSFAAAATTIVSGAVAERMALTAYVWFSVLSVPVYALTACWAWNQNGFLAKMGFHDFAGACVVHMGGGASALAAAKFLGPRAGRFTPKDAYSLASPVTALTGTLLLWWSWLAFNAGSTFLIRGNAWRTAARVTVVTINGSIGGGLAAFLLDWARTYRKGRVISVGHLCTGILAGLVGVTGCCAVVSPAEGLLIGAIGALLALASEPLLEWARVDDPVASVPVHFVGGAWATLATGLFGRPHFDLLSKAKGVFAGGGWRLILVQAAAVLIVSLWWMVWTVLLFALLKVTVGLRVSAEKEAMGSDWVDHGIGSLETASKRLHRLKSTTSKIVAIGRLGKVLPQPDPALVAFRSVMEELMVEDWFLQRLKAKVKFVQDGRGVSASALGSPCFAGVGNILQTGTN